jgi:hypothetical protein
MGLAWQGLPTTSQDAKQLMKRGFKMRVDDVAGNVCLTLWTGIGFASMALSMAGILPAPSSNVF